MDLRRLFLDGDSRIGRQEFWTGLLILAGTTIIIGFIAAALGDMVAGMWGAIVLNGLVGLAMTLPGYFLMVKRSNDRDYPQAYVQATTALVMAFQLQTIVFPAGMGGESLLGALFAVAVLASSLWALVDLGFFPGTAGPNRYGPDPLEVPQT